MEETRRLKDNCPFDAVNISNTKNTVNIVKNWYSSVYFWNIAYNQANLVATQNFVDLQKSQSSRRIINERNLDEISSRLQQQQPQQANLTGIYKKNY